MLPHKTSWLTSPPLVFPTSPCIQGANPPLSKDEGSPCTGLDEAATSIVVYGEVTEYLKSFADFPIHQAAFHTLLRKVYPYPLTYELLERYADLRRAMRPPYGPGLIGDIDTLIAATASYYRLTLVTTDSDFARVPDLSLMHVSRESLRG